MRILFYGDSNTWGYDANTSMRYENRFTQLLKKELSDHEIIEEGFCGRTLCQNDPYDPDRNGTSSIQLLIKSHLPIDLIVIMLGTNDAKRMYSSNIYSLEKGMNALLDKIFVNSLYKHGFIQPKLLIVSPPKMNPRYVKNMKTYANFGNQGFEMLNEAPKILKQVANNYHVDFLESDVIAGNLDGIHLDEQGHRKLSEQLVTKIRSIQNERI